MDLNALFNKYNGIIGVIGSDQFYDVYRPDYTSADQLGTLIVSNMAIRVDTRAQQFAEPALQGGMYFDLFLTREPIQEGDILIPAGLSPTIAYSSKPIITVASISGIKPCVGLISDCIGTLADKVQEPIYSNVRWQWASPGTPKPNNIKVADAIPYERRKAVMYRRENIGLPTPIVKGMRFLHTIDGHQDWWKIVDIMSIGNYTTFQMEQDGT